MSEFQQFKAMLERAGVGHGLRDDYDPPGVSVQVESGETARVFHITEFAFDADGRLTEVISYPGEVG